MPVVGTAGHVDHGKSTLVLALTGRDPDRWAEEKTRGLTIDLGFAWTDLDGVEVSFVDVPGHEHFIKNMLAGIEAIDVALLVVAADEGWKPQSEEHLAVLHLLGVRRGVVAVTKTDRVDPELVELARLEVEERLEGTTLEASPIVPLSATTGTGLDRLRTELAKAVGGVPPPGGDRPRLWVDRSFAIAGAGTVVTGTLLDGPLHVGDRVALWPGEVEGRVRSLQTHEREIVTATPSSRVAVNLAGVDRTRIQRGAMLGIPGQWATTTRFTAVVSPARYVDELTDRGAYHLHVGSGAWPVRVRLLGDGLAAIEVAHPLPLKAGDRFILRETGRRLVMGGGRVVDPAPPRRSREAVGVARRVAPLLDEHPDDLAGALLAARGVEDALTLAAHSGGGLPTGALRAGATWFAPDRAATLLEEARRLVSEFHSRNPLRPGMPTASLASRLDLDPSTLEAILAEDRRLVQEGSTVRLAEFAAGRSAAEEAAWEAARNRLEASGLSVPRVAELGLAPELLHSLVREGDLVRVADDLVYLPGQVEEIVRTIREMPGPFTVSEWKDRVGLSRKYAVPLLEWADGQEITVRMGDRRRLRG